MCLVGFIQELFVASVELVFFLPASDSVSPEPCIYRVAQKNKPLPNDQKIVLNRIKTCEWDKIYSSA